MRSHEFIGMVRMVLDADAQARERAADEATDHLNAYTPAQASALATLLASVAAGEEEQSALEAELHALLELASTGHVSLDQLSPLREVHLAELPPQLRAYVSDLLES
ncbi:hypothetical protein [Streptomyces sp. MAR25Y5]|uniref:hypothetical protein n=1 Tax=Streptomyces sp. MAR25Y5 TaxID=2962028 RepID=UPI0020B72B33|nr:hypothetical protein [Streptomyces sp. MAR25Y5]MCP3767639.1 hypothetical protein [Streptomyces sp. MAR25Y5]